MHTPTEDGPALSPSPSWPRSAAFDALVVGASALWVVFLAFGYAGAIAARRGLGLGRPWPLAVGCAAGALAALIGYRLYYGRAPTMRAVGGVLAVWALCALVMWAGDGMTAGLP